MPDIDSGEPLRIAVGGFALESVSFLPGAAGIEDFERAACRGPELIASLRGAQSPGGGFIDILEQAAASIVPLVYTDLGAGGNASDAAFEYYRDELCGGLRRHRDEIDGVLLFLHGAMTTPTRTDPELVIIDAVRAVVGPEMRIAVASDLHANVSPDFVARVDLLAGYHYSPHTDLDETGRRTARLLLRTLRGEIDPVTVIRKPPVMLPSIFTATSVPPLRDIVAAGFAWERGHDAILDVSVFCGFAYADVPQAGFSVVVVADGDAALAARAADALSARISDARRDLMHADVVHGLEDGVARALDLVAQGRRPVVLLEHADRMNDSTYILRELLRRGAGRVAVPYLMDPQAAQSAIAAGEGAEITLSVGGWSSDRAGGPVEISGKVLFAGEKSYTGTGRMWRGCTIDLGPTALIEANGVFVSLVSRYVFAIDLDPFTQFGLDIADFDIVLLRSKTHFRAVYEEIADEIVIVDTPDWGPADLATLPYRNLRAGVFPLDG